MRARTWLLNNPRYYAIRTTRRSLRRGERRYPRDHMLQFALRRLAVIGLLHPEPDIGSIAAKLAETDRQIGRHRLLLGHDFIERLAGNAEQSRDLGLRPTKRGQNILPQMFSGMHGLQTLEQRIAGHQW